MNNGSSFAALVLGYGQQTWQADWHWDMALLCQQVKPVLGDRCCQRSLQQLKEKRVSELKGGRRGERLVNQQRDLLLSPANLGKVQTWLLDPALLLTKYELL